MYDPKVFPVFFMFLKQTAHQKNTKLQNNMKLLFVEMGILMNVSSEAKGVAMTLL